jgi:DNA polymerase I-like protein with 3'-5' exonuclease and polymerase domains
LGADITKIAMENLFLILEPMGVRFCNTIHDEIVVEAPEEIAGEVARILEEGMYKAGKIFLTDVPCEAETSKPVDKWVK